MDSTLETESVGLVTIVCHECTKEVTKDCEKFDANPLKRNVCRNCFHDAFSHEGTTDE